VPQISLERPGVWGSFPSIMAAVTTPEHVEMHTAPAAQKRHRAEVRTLQVDGNLLAVLGVGIALFALAFGAFTHLSGRIDSLSGRMDSLDAKIEQLATRTDDKFEKINARLDRLFELVASQGRRDTRGTQ